LSGANIDVSGAPVMSKLLVGLTAFGALADACACTGTANAAMSVSAARDRAMDMVRSGYEKKATATAGLKSSRVTRASKNKAR
jgi:hypothetical protein